MNLRKGPWFSGKPKVPKPATGITGVLAKMFRIIQFDLDVNPYRRESMMEEYLQYEVATAERRRREKESRNTDPNKPPLNHSELNRRDRTSIRGNLNKEFNRGSMTWKVFCKTLMFLQIRKFQLIIVAEHRNGVQTEHRGPWVTLDYNQAIDELDQEPEPELELSKPLEPLTSSSITIHEDTPSDQV